MSGFLPSAEQRAVIEAPLGPMRVSAGAGTGKTTTLAHRVAGLVERHGLEPEEVVGITFTNKAAEELADRIRATLGHRVDTGREVAVHTYHGFAAHLLHEFGAFVGVERDTQVVTPTFARQIIESVLRELPTRHFDPTTRGAVESLRRLSSGLSDNLLAARAVTVPRDGDDTWAVRAEMLAALERYEAEKRRLGVADYGDLIHKAHDLVTGHPEVATTVRERYRAVLLDEYQDTNPAQRELLRRLFAGHVPVMAVGDEDQTIYEWRGASLDNFRGFPAHFGVEGEPAPTLPLTRNRRSGPAILDVANRIRARIDPSSRNPLVPLDDAPAGEVLTGWFGTAAEEAAWIAARMIRLHEDGTPWKAMAVLFRKNKDMLLVHDALARHDVPFEVANLGGLTGVPEVADLVSWLRVLRHPDDGPSLARILLGPRFRLGLADLAVLSRWVRRRRGESEPDLDHDSSLPDFTLLEAIDRLEDLDGLRPEALEALDQFRDEYRGLAMAAQGLSLVELTRTVLDRTGAWSDIDAMEPAAGLSARLNVYRFLDLAEDWSPLEGRPSLGGFLRYLDATADETAEELDTARLSEADAVTLITVHRAKGLEWPVVFIPAAYQGNFPNTYGQFDDPTRFAELVPYRLRIDGERLPAIDDVDDVDERKDILRPLRDAQEWRIAYVAVTRAKEVLHVSGAYWYGHPEPKKTEASPGPLFRLVEECDASRPAVATPPCPERPVTLGVRADVSPAPDPVFGEGWPAVLRAALDDPAWASAEAARMGLVEAYDAAVDGFQEMLFTLPEPPPPAVAPPVETSATGLVTYATCPLRFYWSAVDRLPRRVDPSARRGIDVHRRIELHHLGVVPLEEVGPETYDLVTGEAAGGTDPYATFLGSRFAERKPVLVEAPFDLAVDPGVRVRGRIDAVYDHGDHWEVVDFKSGTQREDEARLVQLQTYAVAVEEVPFGVDRPEGLAVTFAYLGGDEAVEDTYRVDDDWLAAARERLDALASGIASEDWNPTPSDACRRCEFLGVCEAGRRHLKLQ